MIFTLHYSLEVMRAWIQAAERSQSLRQSQECIIQAVATDPASHTQDFQRWAESVWEFWRWQYDDLGEVEFAIRIFKAFVDSSARCSVPIHAYVASCLAHFVQENQVWAIQDGRKRFVVDFFFERHPEKCKASITDQVLSKIINDDKGSMAEHEAYRTAQYFRDFRRSQLPRLT